MPTCLTISGENDRIQGAGHGNQINGMKVIGDSLYTCGIDDSVKQVDVASNSYTNADIKLGSQPHGMDVKGDTIITASVKEVSNTPDCVPRLCLLRSLLHFSPTSASPLIKSSQFFSHKHFTCNKAFSILLPQALLLCHLLTAVYLQLLHLPICHLLDIFMFDRLIRVSALVICNFVSFS